MRQLLNQHLKIQTVSRDKSISVLREVIQILLEESQGKLKHRSFKGYGASHPYYAHSSRRSLGLEESPEEDQDEVEIVISRAFKK